MTVEDDGFKYFEMFFLNNVYHVIAAIKVDNYWYRNMDNVQ